MSGAQVPDFNLPDQTGEMWTACDDKICFNPVSLPVSWTVAWRPIVRSRPGR